MPSNARLVPLPKKMIIRQHVPATLVMPQLVENKVCASLLSVTLYFIFSFYFTVSVGETGRAVRTNRGQGGHAYQLEKALNPIMGDQLRKANEGIPENIPENAMAPQAVYKGRSGRNKVISVFYHY
jgi:hypothetical protein